MAVLRIDSGKFEELQKAMREYAGDTESIINDVLHNQAGDLILEEIKRIMPESNRTWKGKKAPAKTGDSLMTLTGNLSVTVKNTKRYQYLYFPDDGTNTRNHVGNQMFFMRGAENQEDEIIKRCINRLCVAFEDTVK